MSRHQSTCPERNRLFGCVAEGRLLIEATGTRDLCFMQSRLAERTGEARQETYEGALVISVGFSGKGLGWVEAAGRPSWLRCFVKSLCC